MLLWLEPVFVDALRKSESARSESSERSFARTGRLKQNWVFCKIQATLGSVPKSMVSTTMVVA